MNLSTVQKRNFVKSRNSGLLKELQGIQSDDDKQRAKSFAILYPLSGSNPEKLYPYWDIFESLLKSPQVTYKYYAIHILANLVSVDRENKFRKIYSLWFNELLYHESPVVSPHIAEKSGKIVKAKPVLEKKVTPILLEAENKSACRHKELLKAYILSALEMYFDIISQKDDVIDFIRKQLNSASPTTKNKAKNLVLKYHIQ